MVDKKKSPMTDSRIQALEKIGFEWKPARFTNKPKVGKASAEAKITVRPEKKQKLDQDCKVGKASVEANSPGPNSTDAHPKKKQETTDHGHRDGARLIHVNPLMLLASISNAQNHIVMPAETDEVICI